MKVWEVPRFSPAYLYQSPLKCVTFSGINTAAMMQQTDHCLLYLSVSFTHLKRSAECSADGPEACPFLSRLTQNVLQNGLRLSRYPSVATSLRIHAEGGFTALVCSGLSGFAPAFKETGQNGV